MTPEQFCTEQLWMGWRALAQRAFGLRPAEVHALTLMMRHPGRVVGVDTLATFDGDGITNSKGPRGSRAGIRRRVSRLLQKLSDVGCGGTVGVVGGLRNQPIEGYVIHPTDAARIHETLLFACGVKIAEAA
jgi:hypothetical protein